MSVGPRLGLRGRLPCPTPRFPSASPAPEAAAATDAVLRHIDGRCTACGIPFSGFAGAETSVVRVDRASWRAACHRAAHIDTPGACQELRAAWRPGTCPASADGPESERS